MAQIEFEGNEYVRLGEGFAFRAIGSKDERQLISFDDAPQSVADAHAALKARKDRVKAHGFDPEDPIATAPKIKITRAGSGDVENYHFGQRSMTPDGLGPTNNPN